MWPAGEELASVRALAQQHAINPMTVSKACSLLEAEGLLERRRGMAMAVAQVRPRSRLALIEPALQAVAQQAAQLGLGLDETLNAFRRSLQQHRVAAACWTASASACRQAPWWAWWGATAQARARCCAAWPG